MKLKKGKSIALFILAIAFIVGCGLLATYGVGKEHKGKASHITLGLDLKGGVSVTYHIKDKKFTNEQFNDTIYKLEQRVYIYSTEAEVYKEGEDNITVDIPGQFDAQTILEELGKPGSLMFVTVAEDGYTGDDTYTAKDGTVYKVWVDGSDIDDAQGKAVSDDENRKQSYVVSLTFTKEGAVKFEEATRENLNKQISILYDDQIISSPTVKSVITGGEAVIEGQESMEAANNLASTIRIGSLSLELEEISSKVVSAKLGNDAVKTSLTAGLIGLLIVMLFMICVYRVPGLVASIALTLYTIFELLVLNAFNLTLTLPGIAGIILSIGMAVDANVIIYARIKEELATGKAVDSAILVGFKKATSAIVDGNITTLIAVFVLYALGSGPVKGFAITLGIGIVLSLFTAMIVSRGLVYLFYSMGFKDKKFYGVQKERRVVNFVKRKALFFSISILCIIVSAVIMLVHYSKNEGLFNYSIEFNGGTATTVEFGKAYTIDEFNDQIKPEIAKVIGSNDIQGQKETNSNRFVIKTQLLDDTKRAALKELLVSKYGAVLENENADLEETNISSSVSNKTRRDAVVSVIIATICMLIYIWFRFRNIKFATAAVIALLHDVLIVIGFYAISRISVGTTFIACMLTIVGYSINATIVIFDRIREKLANTSSKNIDLQDVVNRSITDTLTRSIYTSFTTFVTIFVLFLLGVAAIKEFALPIMVGIIAGGYSSVFVTGSLWYIMSKKAYKTKEQ
ncbi:SecD/SecF fusion protein [Lachnospiraceae bacterium RM5]|nr:SecD/SecF fusion protein [Lachnospiraceae bacterium RM5]